MKARIDLSTPFQTRAPHAINPMAGFGRETGSMRRRFWNRWLLFLLSVLAVFVLSPSTRASIAWGSINNFDAVNDTGVECHGFEIELDGLHSRDISYTYDWNHYGVPKITEDNTDPLAPKVFVRYESAKNPDGSWAAFTALRISAYSFPCPGFTRTISTMKNRTSANLKSGR